MKKKGLLALCGLISLLLVFLTACDTVSGVELNKVLTNNATVQSYEGNQTVSLQLVGDPDADLSTSERQMFALLSNLTLNLNTVKYQDKETMSAAGDLALGNTKIPFQLYMSKDQIVFQPEGANKPVVLDMASLLNLSESEIGPSTGPLDMATMNNMNEMVTALVPLIVKQLPNPNTIKVEDATVKINNESLNLKKVHAEIKGSEVAGLLKTFLQNIISDDKTLKELVNGILPIISAAAEASGEEADNPLAGLDASKIDLMLPFIKAEVSDMLNEMDESLNSDEAKEILNDKNTVKADVFVDKDMQIRKSAFEISISAPEGEPSPLKSIKITVSSEMWNVNRMVKASVIDSSKGLVLGPQTKIEHFLKTLDSKSSLSQLLVNDLHVNRKNINLRVRDKMIPGAPYIKNNASTMVPVRFVSEKLGADVQWDAAKKEVTVTDIMTDKKIVLTLDSQTAYVDGKEVQLETAAELSGDYTYVPVAFIATTLGAKVEWNNDTRSVLITKN